MGHLTIMTKQSTVHWDIKVKDHSAFATFVSLALFWSKVNDLAKMK
jgi:hypothetical protein